MGARPLTSRDRLDPRSADLIRFKARQLAGRDEFLPGEQEDLEQELALHLVGRMRRYDPARASERTFADRVLTNRASGLLDHARARKRDRRREEPFVDGLPDRGLEELRERLWDAERLDLELDLRDGLAALDEADREVAELLCVYSVAEVSRKTGLSRQRVRTICGRVREHLLARGLP